MKQAAAGDTAGSSGLLLLGQGMRLMIPAAFAARGAPCQEHQLLLGTVGSLPQTKKHALGPEEGAKTSSSPTPTSPQTMFLYVLKPKNRNFHLSLLTDSFVLRVKFGRVG